MKIVSKYYKLGRNLDADGNARGGWSSWVGVPRWFSWENQGGAIAAREISRSTALIIAAVDKPLHQNAGIFQQLSLAADPRSHGKWDVVHPFNSAVLAVHAAAVHTGDIVFYAGSGNNTVRASSPQLGDPSTQVWTSAVWTPYGNTFAHPNTLHGIDGKVVDFFCGGEAFLPDGRLLLAGGTEAYDDPGHHGFFGRRDAALYDPTTRQWTPTQAMSTGRWHPTLITLPNGHVLAAAGLDEHSNHTATLEEYDPDTGEWVALVGPVGGYALPNDAHLFPLADDSLNLGCLPAAVWTMTAPKALACSTSGTTRSQ